MKNDLPIEDLIVHRPPMILIDELISADDSQGLCSVTIKEDSEFFDAQRQGVPSYIGSEYMAQAIAAYAGAKAKRNNEEIKIGFLLGSRKISCHSTYFPCGSKLMISVAKLIEDESGLSVFECKITADDALLVEAKINVFQPQDPLQFIKENK